MRRVRATKRKRSSTPPAADGEETDPTPPGVAAPMRRKVGIVSSGVYGAAGTPTNNGCGSHSPPGDDTWQARAREWQHCSCPGRDRKALLHEIAPKFADQVHVPSSQTPSLLVPLTPDQRALVHFIVGMLLGETPKRVLFTHGGMWSWRHVSSHQLDYTSTLSSALDYTSILSSARLHFYPLISSITLLSSHQLMAFCEVRAVMLI